MSLSYMIICVCHDRRHWLFTPQLLFLLLVILGQRLFRKTCLIFVEVHSFLICYIVTIKIIITSYIRLIRLGFGMKKSFSWYYRSLVFIVVDCWHLSFGLKFIFCQDLVSVFVKLGLRLIGMTRMIRLIRRYMVYLFPFGYFKVIFLWIFLIKA